MQWPMLLEVPFGDREKEKTSQVALIELFRVPPKIFVGFIGERGNKEQSGSFTYWIVCDQK